jgi:REP element-mobilizing transposase RayT
VIVCGSAGWYCCSTSAAFSNSTWEQGRGIFLADEDRAVYCALMAEQARRFQAEVWGYCLIPNHVHLILVPGGPDSLGNALGESHRPYTSYIDALEQSRDTIPIFLKIR